jgi:hypothetical protein
MSADGSSWVKNNKSAADIACRGLQPLLKWQYSLLCRVQKLLDPRNETVPWSAPLAACRDYRNLPASLLYLAFPTLPPKACSKQVADNIWPKLSRSLYMCLTPKRNPSVLYVMLRTSLAPWWHSCTSDRHSWGCAEPTRSLSSSAFCNEEYRWLYIDSNKWSLGHYTTTWVMCLHRNARGTWYEM